MKVLATEGTKLTLVADSYVCLQLERNEIAAVVLKIVRVES